MKNIKDDQDDQGYQDHEVFIAGEGNTEILYLVLEAGSEVIWVRLSRGAVPTTCTRLVSLLSRVGIDYGIVELAAITAYLPTEPQAEAILAYAGIEINKNTRVRDLLCASSEYFHPVDYGCTTDEDDLDEEDSDWQVISFEELIEEDAEDWETEEAFLPGLAIVSRVFDLD